MRHFITRSLAAGLSLAALASGSIWAGSHFSRKNQPAESRKSIARVPEAFRGNIYGSVGFFQGMTHFDQAFWGSINGASGEVTPLFRSANFTNGEDYDLQGGTVRKGIFYTPSTPTDITGTKVLWKRVDLSTQKWLDPIDFNGNYAAMGYAMTYNPDDDRFYIISLDDPNEELSYFCSVNPETWDVTEIGHFEDEPFIAGITYCPVDQSLYVLGSSNAFYRIDEDESSDTGYTLAKVADLDPRYSFVDNSRATAITYSPKDHAFVAFLRNNSTQTFHIAYIDFESFDVTITPELSPKFSYFISLYCPDVYGEGNAPDQPAMPTVAVMDPALDGTITFSVPTETYDGDPISEKLATNVSIDGEAIFSEDMEPGSEKKISFSTTEGLHTLSISCSLKGLRSPERKVEFYTGHDNPMPPSDVMLRESRLTWTAPGETGAHNGYVETSALCYDVMINDVKVNQTPITTCEFMLPADYELGRRNIQVVATANGKSSEPAIMSAVIGEALELPVNMSPTKAEADLFTIVDSNNDGIRFNFGKDDYGLDNFSIYVSPGSTADDWLFLPLVSIPDNSVLYNMNFTISGYTPYDASENVEVVLARNPDANSVISTIKKYESVNMAVPSVESVRFAVPEAGEYCIGFHCTSSSRDGGNGIKLYSFSTIATEDSSAVPAEPSVTAAAAPKGALSATVKVTAPTCDMTGKALPAESISVSINAGAGEETTSVMPGETVSVETKVPNSGFANFNVTLGNGNGNSNVVTHTAYVGIDTPMPPTNIRSVTSDDNLSAHITWDAPSEVGEHGGYVDIENLNYRIYSAIGVTLNDVGSTRNTEYTFTTLDQNLTNLSFGPSAYNSVGESSRSQFQSDVLGRPYTVPMKEIFSSYSGFNYNPHFFNSGEGFENSTWEPVGSIIQLAPNCDEDCEEGALVVYTTTFNPTKGELVIPKVSSLGSENLTFSLRWLDYTYTPVFSLWGRRSDSQDLEKIATFNPERPENAVWVDSRVVLPEEYANQGWIQFRIGAELTGEMQEYGYIDSYTVSQEVDTDFRMTTIDGNTEPKVGEEWDYTIGYANAGLLDTSSVIDIVLKGNDGSELLRTQKEVYDLPSGMAESVSVIIPMLREYLDISPLSLTATSNTEGDMVTGNNSISMTINVSASTIPTVGDLSGTRNDDRSVTLSWNDPDLTYGGQDDFEIYTPFELTDEIGLWRNLDLDEQVPFLINGANRWDGDDLPCAWTVIDSDAIGAPRDSRFYAHKGKQYIMARNASFDESDEDDKPEQSSDWLISPEVIGGTDISFYYCTGDSQYTEYVELHVSKTGNDPEDFEYVRTFSKSGDEAWEAVKYRLPEDTKYFALVYRSIDSFCAMLDDIAYTPAKLSEWEIDHYRVLRVKDGESQPEVISEKCTTNSFTDDTIGRLGATYYVSAAVKVGTFNMKYGPMSNAAKVISLGIDDITLLTGVTGGDGVIIAEGLAGETIAVYDAAGMFIQLVEADRDHIEIPAQKGIYIVKAGNRGTKVMVK